MNASVNDHSVKPKMNCTYVFSHPTSSVHKQSVLSVLLFQVHVDHGLLHPNVRSLGDEKENPAACGHLEDHLEID